MKRNFKKIFLLMAIVVTAMVCFAISASAKYVSSSGVCGDNVYFTYNSTTKELTISGSGNMTNYNYSSSPFYESDIKSVVIKNGVTSIGKYAFYKCKNLISVNVSSSVTTINDQAFGWCESLEYAKLGENTTIIGLSAFAYCTSLEQVDLGAKLEYIRREAFYNCENLKAVDFPTSLTNIGEFSFYSCKSIKNVYIPKNVQYIGEYAFWQCDSLTEYSVDNNNEMYSSEHGILYTKDKKCLISHPIGKKASFFILPENVERIEKGAFIDNDTIEYFGLPNRKIDIGDSAFENTSYYNNAANWENGVLYIGKHLIIAKELTVDTYAIKKGTLNIANGAFELPGSQLKEITVPSSVVNIGQSAFGSNELVKITVDRNNLYYSSDSFGVLFDKNKINLVCCPENCSMPSYIIPDTVEKILPFAFMSNNNIESLIIGKNVKLIGEAAFNSCQNLKKIAFPVNVPEREVAAFWYCNNLKDVYYSGSKEQWESAVEKETFPKATIHYNANTIPDENALFTLHAFASHPRLVLGYGGAIDMVFELECYNANIGSSFLVSNPTFTFTSSNPDIFEIAEISNNGKNTSIRLYENGKGGKAHLIVSAYVDGKFKAARQFEVTTSGELVYDMDTILRAAAGELEGSLATELYWHNMQVDNFKYVETGDECNLSFDVYNMVNFIGAVEVYDKDGNLIENRYVDPFEGNMPTGLWDAGKYLYDIATLDFKDNDYKSELRSKKTSVSLYGVPLDGRVVFTSDIDSSAVCAAYNIADIIMKTCLEAISVVDTSKSVTKKATEKLVEELLEAVSLKENAKNTFNKILDRYFKVADLGDESSMIKSMKEFLNFISSMDIDIGEIVLETLKESGITVVERLVTYTLGTIGKVTDVVFKFVSVSNIIEHAQNVSAFRGSRDTSLYFRKYASYKLTSNGYHVSNDDAFSEEITFHQFKIMSGDKLYQALDEFADVEYLDVVSMAIYKNGKEVQPGGEVQVAIPLPEGMSFLNVRVYRQESDGSFTKLDCDFSDVRDGYIYITTDHFSVYCIAGEKIKETAMHFEQQNYTIYTGESVMPKPVLTPANAYMPEIKAVSSNTRVATVTDDGMVKGVSQGTASITVTSENGTSAKFNVTVLSDPNAIPGRASKTASVQNTSAIKLAWDAVPGAAGYRVYQRVGNNWKALGNTSKTTATINKLKAGTKYSFAVIAGAVDSGKVIWSDIYTVINTATKTVTPAKVASAQNTSALKLAWSACPGATGYRIFYKSGNTWKVALSTTSATSHLFSGLKAGTKYTFAVRPYIINSGNVIWSDYVQFTAATKPAAPMVKSSSTDSSITLYWDAVSADGYRIYYRTASSDWKIAVNSLTDTHHTFAGLKSGSSYIFAVRPYVKTTLGVVWGEYKAVAAGVNKTNIQKIDINVSEMYIDTDGVLSMLIDTSDWDGELVPNSQYVSCRMDYEESDVPLLLTLTDEVDSDGYQRLTADFGEDNEYFDYYYISFTIPEGFIRNKSGTQYNNSLGLIW